MDQDVDMIRHEDISKDREVLLNRRLIESLGEEFTNAIVLLVRLPMKS